MAFLKCIKNSRVIPNGKTVTPTDDVQIWLHCADIWDKTYTNISQVLSDNNTLFALLTTDNAIDYMIRSTSWITDVTSSSSALYCIYSYDYVASEIIGDAIWRANANNATPNYINNEKVPQMTSDTAPKGTCISDSVYSSYSRYKAFDNDNATYWCSSTSNTTGGQYIGYQFGGRANVFAIQMYSTASSTSNAKVQYSDDGSSWTDTGTTFTITSSDLVKTVWVNNSGSHKYWRVYCTSSTAASRFGTYTLRFFGRDNGGVQDWLRAGGITDKKYTDIENIFNDSTTLNTLLTSNSAWDYIVTAKGFINQEFRSIDWSTGTYVYYYGLCENPDFMTALGNSNYASNLLLSDADWVEAIVNSQYSNLVLNVQVPTMTSNTAPSGVASAIHEYSSYLAFKAFDKKTANPNWWVDTNAVNVGATSPEGWVGYMFTSAKKIYCATHATNASVPIQEWNIKGSNDGSNWITLGSGGVQSSGISVLPCNISVSSYQYYRLYLKQKNGSSSAAHLPNAYEVQFYGREDVT